MDGSESVGIAQSGAHRKDRGSSRRDSEGPLGLPDASGCRRSCYGQAQRRRLSTRPLTCVAAGGGAMERAEALAPLVSTAQSCLIHRSRTPSVRWRKKVGLMNQLVSIVAVDDIPGRDRTAQCAACGRVGTWAWIAHGHAPRVVERYCRRCWPAAQRRSDDVTWNALAAHHEAWRDWHARVRPGPRAQQEPTPAMPDLGDRAMGWHWTLSPGTWWRALRREIPAMRALRRLSNRGHR